MTLCQYCFFPGKGKKATWMYQKRYVLLVNMCSTVCSCSSLSRYQLRDLALIFEKDYHFNVQLEQLEESEKAQLQLEKILATFKYENEGSKNLCILYYAGHGFSEAKTGDLRLTR